MGVKGGVFILLVLVVSWACVDARNLAGPDFTVLQVNSVKPKRGNAISDANVSDKRVCTLCEKFTSEALSYFNQSKTQSEIIDSLHETCSRLFSIKQQCMTLVDYYAPLFFLEITTIHPGDFCEKMNLCDEQFPPSSCKMCHEAVEEVRAKLDDPDTQLEIIEILLKVCDAEKQYAKKCKKLVFEFGPLMLANAEKYLATRDLCTTFHACKPSADKEEAAFIQMITSPLTQ